MPFDSMSFLFKFRHHLLYHLRDLPFLLTINASVGLTMI